MRAATLARISLVALVVATFLAIFYAQERKREAKLLLRPYPGVRVFDPAGGATGPPGVRREAHFWVRASVADRLDVSVVSEATGRTVFEFHVVVREYRSVHLAWDGRGASGAPEPPGAYRLLVRFHAWHQTVPAPLVLALVRRPA